MRLRGLYVDFVAEEHHGQRALVVGEVDLGVELLLPREHRVEAAQSLAPSIDSGASSAECASPLV